MNRKEEKWNLQNVVMQLTMVFVVGRYDLQAVGRFFFRVMRDATMTRDVAFFLDVLVSRPSGNQ